MKPNNLYSAHKPSTHVLHSVSLVAPVTLDPDVVVPEGQDELQGSRVTKTE
jgi:hypothetical protein